MRQILYLLVLLWPVCSLAQESVSRYQISVSGPLAEFREACDDPCAIERVEVVGKVEAEMGVADDAPARESRRKDPMVGCSGNCDGGPQQQSRMTMKPPRTLREGVEVKIRNSSAKFVFYSVTDTDEGPATLQQHSSFRIDRPLIELELHDHDVVVRRILAE